MIHNISRYLLTLVALFAMTASAWAEETATITLKCGTTEKTYENVTLPWSTTAEILKEVITDFKLSPGIGAITGGNDKVVKYGNENFTVTGTFSGEATVAVSYVNTSWASASTTITVTAPGPLMTLSDDGKTATMESMPANDVTVDYELVRDMTVDVDATIANRIRIKKDGTTYVPVTATELVPVVLDALDEQNPVTMVLYNETDKTGDYTVKLQKKVEGDTPSWTDVTALSVGTFRYVITGANLYDGEITTPEFQLFEGYEVTVPAGEYVTYFKDENLYVEDPEAQLYTITSVGTETATATELTVAKANMPILVKNNGQEKKVILLIPTTNEADNVLAATQFVGTLVATTIPASTDDVTNYALNGKQFVWVKDAIPVGANKAWLSIPASNAPALSIVFGGETTGVKAIDNSQFTIDKWYDLNGRKLNAKPTKKGVYIMNGRKVVVK